MVSPKTVTKDTLNNISKFMQLYESPEMTRKFKEAIAEEANISCDHIWVDMARPPSFKEGMKWPIKSLGTDDGYVRLREVIPVDDWVKAFEENKWQGYIFSSPEYTDVVYRAAKVALKEAFGIEVNKYSHLYCKYAKALED